MTISLNGLELVVGSHVGRVTIAARDWSTCVRCGVRRPNPKIKRASELCRDCYDVCRYELDVWRT